MIKYLTAVLRKYFWLILVAVFVFGMIFLYSGRKAPVVVETSPKNGDREIITTTQISIKFAGEVPEKDHGRISVSLSPEAGTTSVWLKNQLNIIPTTPLVPGANYAVSIKHGGRQIYQFSFETILFPADQITREGQLQAQDDFAFGEAFKDFATKYPWYLSLPRETTEYRIVYDFETASFRIRLKLVPKDEAVKDALIKKALEDLKKIGVPEPIKYYLAED